MTDGRQATPAFSTTLTDVTVGLLQRLNQRHPVVGHRVLVGLGLKSANSTLAAHPDGHLAHTGFSTTSGDANKACCATVGTAGNVLATESCSLRRQ